MRRTLLLLLLLAAALGLLLLLLRLGGLPRRLHVGQARARHIWPRRRLLILHFLLPSFFLLTQRPQHLQGWK